MCIRKKSATKFDEYKFTFKVEKELQVKTKKKVAAKILPSSKEAITQEKSKIFSMSYFREVYADYLINQFAQN